MHLYNCMLETGLLPFPSNCARVRDRWRTLWTADIRTRTTGGVGRLFRRAPNLVRKNLP